MIGKQVRKTTRVVSKMGYDIEITTIVKTERNKHIILLSNGSMLTTFRPELFNITIETEIEVIPTNKILEFMTEIDSIENFRINNF